MHVTVSAPEGGTHEVTPFALADLGDHDNYVQLCLDTSAPALSVRVEPGTCARLCGRPQRCDGGGRPTPGPGL